ncbi:MAG: hypothetical protein AAF288_08170 [Planctomycetota bacterium]
MPTYQAITIDRPAPGFTTDADLAEALSRAAFPGYRLAAAIPACAAEHQERYAKLTLIFEKVDQGADYNAN